jgi:glycerol-3-phosphate dehydrogenase (NAD(P)+)
MSLLSNVCVIGAGSWGCALANILAKKSQKTNLFSSRDDFIESFNKSHTSPSLIGVSLAKNIFATNDFSLLKLSEIIFIVTDVKRVEKVFKQISDKISQGSIIVLCSKGFSNDGKLFSQIFQKHLPKQKFAILSGPNFAIEVAQKKFSTTTIAGTDLAAINKIYNAISAPYFSPKISQDVITTQVAGTIKNIIAISCGLVDGLGLGTNCKAALINKGLEEICFISQSLGGRPLEELSSPAVFGDLFLTCSSNKSRNYSYGINIASGNKDKNFGVTCEGIRSAEILPKFLDEHPMIDSSQLKLCLLMKEVIFGKINISAIEQSIIGLFQA